MVRRVALNASKKRRLRKVGLFHPCLEVLLPLVLKRPRAVMGRRRGLRRAGTPAESETTQEEVPRQLAAQHGGWESTSKHCSYSVERVEGGIMQWPNTKAAFERRACERERLGALDGLQNRHGPQSRNSQTD